jgi:hypothetical protein
MPASKIPTQEQLDGFNKSLSYNEHTGDLVWKIAPSNSVVAGQIAGSIELSGYRSVRLKGKAQLAHRVAWFLFYKTWPLLDIDHLDGKKDNNKIENLRLVDKLENCKNLKKSKRNTSGVTGVHWNKKLQKWKVAINSDCRNIHLGYFTEFNLAVETRKQAEKDYNFHPNHGR